MSDRSNLPQKRTGTAVHRAGLAGSTVTILGLVYAALDDLTTSADGLFPEFFFIAGSIPLLVFLWRRFRSTFDD